MLIEAKGLQKNYGTKTALQGVNLKIAEGQLIAYLGTNGAGKSTTINILSRLLKPSAGIISEKANLKIGMVFQDSVLDDRLSVQANLKIRAAMYRGISASWLKELEQLIGIDGFLRQKYGTLSGGQKRRVDIARGLLNHPDLLFLDEPTTGLDLQTRNTIWQLLEKLRREQNLAIFLTTHYLEEAESADYMYILENGQVLQSGSAAEIKRQFAPNVLTLWLKPQAKLNSHFKMISHQPNIVEINAISDQDAITLINQQREKIARFEFRQGSIDLASIGIFLLVFMVICAIIVFTQRLQINKINRQLSKRREG